MQLIVGTDSFIFEAPSAFKEYGFKGSECSIAFSQEPSSVFVMRNWIVITGLTRGRQVQLAIRGKRWMAVWIGPDRTAIAGLSAQRWMPSDSWPRWKPTC